MTKRIYETNYQSGTVEIYSLRGTDLGTFVRVPHPTGLVFDDVGNLYVSSDKRPNYTIQKFAPDGTGSIFADSGLSGPHALVFDGAGNLYVANADDDTIEKFTPDGVGTVFADGNDGLNQPLDLAFDTAGNLYVSNLNGGNTIEKFSSTGEDLGVFAYTGGGPHFLTMFRPTAN